jgi:hypothetical protein
MSRIRRNQLSRIVVAAALIVPAMACGDVARQGRSPVYLVIDSLQAAPGNKPAQFSGGALLSDVQTIVTSGGVCSSVNPCPTIFDDFGQVVLHAPLKDITSVTGPTTNNEVTISRFHVNYRRSDGRNTPGVDVPYAFDGAVTGTVPANGSISLNFELVRHVAKEESPLVQLRANQSVITTLAEVTFFGTDRVGNAISVTGTMQVNFGNFADQ